MPSSYELRLTKCNCNRECSTPDPVTREEEALVRQQSLNQIDLTVWVGIKWFPYRICHWIRLLLHSPHIHLINKSSSSVQIGNWSGLIKRTTCLNFSSSVLSGFRLFRLLLVLLPLPPSNHHQTIPGPPSDRPQTHEKCGCATSGTAPQHAALRHTQDDELLKQRAAQSSFNDSKMTK